MQLREAEGDGAGRSRRRRGDDDFLEEDEEVGDVPNRLGGVPPVAREAPGLAGEDRPREVGDGGEEGGRRRAVGGVHRRERQRPASRLGGGRPLGHRSGRGIFFFCGK